MNYKEAKTKSINTRLIGSFIALLAAITTIISALKFLYFRLDDGTQFGSAIAQGFKNLVVTIYENTQFLSIFWEHAPTPNQFIINDPNNYKFFVVYILFFIGIAINASGVKLARRLRRIQEQIENQIIQESLKGEKARSKEEIESSVKISNESFLSRIQQLYIAPIITAVVAGIILKLSGF